MGPPLLTEQYNHETYDNEVRKNFVRPVGYVFMKKRQTSSYELLWRTLKEEIDGLLDVDWQGPDWIMQDFERAPMKVLLKVS